MIDFTMTRPTNLGFLPSMLSVSDPRPAREQFDERYKYGGGWQPVRGFELDAKSRALLYPGDPPMKPVATAQLRDEMILVYPYSFVAVVQADGSFEAARMD